LETDLVLFGGQGKYIPIWQKIILYIQIGGFIHYGFTLTLPHFIMDTI